MFYGSPSMRKPVVTDGSFIDLLDLDRQPLNVSTSSLSWKDSN